MKKIVLSFISIVMLCLSGCFKTGDSIETLPPMAAFVSFDLFQPVIITQYGTFFLPTLPDDLTEGDAIWTQFQINYDQQQPSSKYYMASEFQYYKVGKSAPMETTGGMSTNDFDFPIANVAPVDRVKYNWGDYLFFVFELSSSGDKEFIYEMTYDPNEKEVVYLRAKESASTGTHSYLYAFDMSYYYTTLPGYSDNKVSFNIMYQTGADENQPWSGNPCVIYLNIL